MRKKFVFTLDELDEECVVFPLVLKKETLDEVFRQYEIFDYEKPSRRKYERLRLKTNQVLSEIIEDKVL